MTPEPVPTSPGGESAARVEVLGRLDADEIAAVSLLLEEATEADGVRPLSEHVALHLRHGGDAPVRNLLMYAPDGQLAGYAHLDVTDVVEGSSAELVIAPAHRRRGYGRRLVAEVLAATPDGRLRLWSHGEHAGATELARGMGLERSRALWQMRRSLFAPLPAPAIGRGVTIRTFRPGVDDRAWLELNALAFAHHPEQGSWTRSDLRRRIDEPWFDAAGFFLASRQAGDAEQLVGFHWTKVHGGTEHARPDGTDHVHAHEGLGPHTHDTHGHEPMGEVYVVGVHPQEQGHGLGRALTLIGLRHLRSIGLGEAMLYVDADNVAAIRLYTDLGFTRWDTDVMFRT